MRHFVKVLFTALGGLALLTVEGYSQDSLRLLHVVEDHYIPHPPASNPLPNIAGIEIASRSTRVGRSTIWLRLPETNMQYLCLRVTSRNGQFRYMGLYSVVGRGGSFVQARIRTTHLDRLNRFENDEVAVLAQLTRQGCGNPEMLIAASWQANPQKDSIVLMLASSFTPVLRERTSENSVLVNCKSLPLSHFAYQRRCTTSHSAMTGARSYIMQVCDGRCANFEFVLFVW